MDTLSIHIHEGLITGTSRKILFILILLVARSVQTAFSKPRAIYTSGATAVTLRFQWCSCFSIFFLVFCVMLYFRLLVTPLVSSNLPRYKSKTWTILDDKYQEFIRISLILGCQSKVKFITLLNYRPLRQELCYRLPSLGKYAFMMYVLTF